MVQDARHDEPGSNAIAVDPGLRLLEGEMRNGGQEDEVIEGRFASGGARKSAEQGFGMGEAVSTEERMLSHIAAAAAAGAQ